MKGQIFDVNIFNKFLMIDMKQQISFIWIIKTCDLDQDLVYVQNKEDLSSTDRRPIFFFQLIQSLSYICKSVLYKHKRKKEAALPLNQRRFKW